jgi:hypothetical protein
LKFVTTCSFDLNSYALLAELNIILGERWIQPVSGWRKHFNYNAGWPARVWNSWNFGVWKSEPIKARKTIITDLPDLLVAITIVALSLQAFAGKQGHELVVGHIRVPYPLMKFPGQVVLIKYPLAIPFGGLPSRCPPETE